MTKRDVLFEIGCEELPSRSVLPLAEALAQGITLALKEKSLNFGAVTFYAAPRRLAVWIQAVDETTKDEFISRKGPAVSAGLDSQGQPTGALLGFAKSCGVNVKELSIKKTPQGEWYYFEATRPGSKTEMILASLLQQALSHLPITKPMYWEANTGPFVRPVHWVVLLWGEEVIPASYYGIETGRLTYGHRFHHPGSIALSHPRDYEPLLEKGKVMPAFQKRREQIVGQIEALAKTQQAIAVMPDELLDEVTSIVEWPQALLAHFSDEFLSLPQEVLIASMQSHLKCFALKNSSGDLLSSFIIISNIQSQSPEQVIAGNEKVMQARLSDAAFFFSQDRKAGLSSFISATTKTLFQAKLGTLADQVNRMQSVLAEWNQLLGLDINEISRALSLSKCDLMSGMVGEFPELQGVMGYHYALLDGESKTVAKALDEQYWPRFANDHLPETELGLALSLVSRLDTLVGIFGIGGKPSGMKDPFKLRRHALAVLRLLESYEKPLKLSECITQVIEAYPADVLDLKAVSELKTFILERLPAYYASQGVPEEMVASVCAVQSEWIYDLAHRIHALIAVRSHLEPLLGGAKRVSHILKGIPQNRLEGEVEPKYFKEPAESALFEAIVQVEQDIAPHYTAGEYEPILYRLTQLRPQIDAFFDTVRVMAEDESIQLNRLRLLHRLQHVLLGVADLSRLQGL